MQGDLFAKPSSELAPRALSAKGWKGGATFSRCGRFRYTLHRVWPDGEGSALVIMLNPSTADQDTNDPTVARVCGFLRAEGIQDFTVMNLFARVTPYPSDLVQEVSQGLDVVGPENDATIARLAAEARFVLVAWGMCSPAPKLAKERARALCTGTGPLAGRELHALRVTSAGAPEHPLYLPGTCRPTPYARADLERWIGRRR